MKTRLSFLYFLQFGVWGSYLTSFGQFLGAGGLGARIAWFYAAVGVVSIITPAVMGHLADRYIRPVNLLGICHLLAGLLMMGMWFHTLGHTSLDFGFIFPLYLLFLAFYMPTMALANTASFGIMKSRGYMPVDAFPAIRVWGTVGFVAAMWFVNSTYYHDGVLGWTLSDADPYSRYRFQYNNMQLLCAGFLGICTSIYVFTLPRVKASAAGETPTASSKKAFIILNVKALKEFFRLPALRGFLIFVALIGVCLQISNGFATPFITHFMGDELYGSSFAAGNATMLFSLSQISEALFLLATGKALKRWGIGIVFGLGMLAWGLRFLFFGLGNPGDGLIFLVLSMVVYGIAFNFITIAGHLYIDQASPAGSKGMGQGVMMLMGNGIGATLGILGAGEIINHWCSWETVITGMGAPLRLFMGDWTKPWLIFAAYAFLLGLLWIAVRFSLKRHKFSQYNPFSYLPSKKGINCA